MNKLTIFGDNSAFNKDIQAAIKSLINGQTPVSEIRERETRGGGTTKYVNAYYMTRQAALLTGWRWSSECLREKWWPNETDPSEIGALMQVTLYDQDGNAFRHQSWGSAEIKKWKETGRGHIAGMPISIFDDLKSAYTDGIKKCLSYFGIANDIYGGKDLSENYFNADQEQSIVQYSNSEARSIFDAYVRKNNVRYDIVLKLLNAQSLNDVTDWSTAYNTIKEWISGGRKQV